MNEEAVLSLSKLKNALLKLKEGLDRGPGDDLACDGVIQRFEFTYELLWKTLKVIFEEHGVSLRYPKEIFQEAFKAGYFEDDKAVGAMLKDRNVTSHVYDKEVVREIYFKIKNAHIFCIESIVKKIGEIQ